MNQSSYDIVTFGECMLRFSPPEGQMLEQAEQLRVDPAGSESNMAVALARLGVRVAWLSALPDTAVGRWVTSRLETHGVDVSHVVWTNDRAGVFFFEPGRPPRGSRVVYDRAHSAISRITPDRIDWARVTDTRLMHISGITPALSPSCCETAMRAVAETKKRERLTSLDINYRAKLWSPEQAARTLIPFFEQVDILVSTESDIRLLLGINDGANEMITHLRHRFSQRVIVITLAEGGAMAWSEATGMLHTGPHEVEQVDRLGAGDAFDAGLLFGILKGDLRLGLACGSALAAISYSERGDTTWATTAEILKLAGYDSEIEERRAGQESPIL